MNYSITTFAFSGIQPMFCEVSAKIETDRLPGFDIPDLKEASVREIRIRVQSAIQNQGFQFPRGLITISIKGFVGRKQEGTHFDLPIALAVLAASGQIKADKEPLCFGELSLNGLVRPVRGAILASILMDPLDKGQIICAKENAHEVWTGLSNKEVLVASVQNLRDAASVMKLGRTFETNLLPIEPKPDFRAENDYAILPQYRKQIRALAVAAVGGFNIFMVGGPGCGATMLARRLVSILPDLSRDQAIDTTAVNSVAGLTIGSTALITKPPFRAPHHSTTPPGLVGGGVWARPGEISLAHNGVLYLDQVSEFAKNTLEVLREPINTKSVVLNRASGTLAYPAAAQIVVRSDPCPCGRFPDSRCACKAEDINRYLNRAIEIINLCEIRMDIPLVDLRNEEKPDPKLSSWVLKEAITKARKSYLMPRATATRINLMAEEFELPKASFECLREANIKLDMSVKDYFTTLNIAKTISDLDAQKDVSPENITEALSMLNRRAK